MKYIKITAFVMIALDRYAAPIKKCKIGPVILHARFWGFCFLETTVIFQRKYRAKRREHGVSAGVHAPCGDAGSFADLMRISAIAACDSGLIVISSWWPRAIAIVASSTLEATLQGSLSPKSLRRLMTFISWV